MRLAHRGAERLAGPGVFVIPYGPVRSGVFESAQFLVQTGGEDVAYCAQRLFFKRRGAERRICEVPLEPCPCSSPSAYRAPRASRTRSPSRTRWSRWLRRRCRPGRRRSGGSWPSSSVCTTTSRSPSASARTPRCRSARPSSPRSRSACTGWPAPSSATATCAEPSSRAGRGSISTHGAIELIDSTMSRVGARVAAGAGGAAAHRLVSRPAGQRRSAVRGGRARLRLRRAGRARLGHRSRHPPRSALRRLSGVRGRAPLRRGRDGTHGGALPGGGRLARADPRGGRIASTRAASEPSSGRSSGNRALGAAESARGETLYWLEADDDSALRFCKLRAASFVNFGVFNRVFDSQVLTDFSFIEHSLGLSPAGCDA